MQKSKIDSKQNGMCST